jgi:hypothetical protein
MSTEDAVYVLAHQYRVPMRHLDSSTLVRVSEYVSRLGGAAAPAAAPRSSARPAIPKPVLVDIAGLKMEAIPGMTASHAREAKTMATRVYPLLYLFENSARDVITRVLKAEEGNDWWNKVVPKGVRDQADGNIKTEGREAWHGKRSNDPIDYVDLPQLATIVTDDKVWPYFQPLFSRKNWFEGLVQDLNVSRRVAAHMNPLASDDIQGVEVIFRKWVKQLQAKAALLP